VSSPKAVAKTDLGKKNRRHLGDSKKGKGGCPLNSGEKSARHWDIRNQKSGESFQVTGGGEKKAGGQEMYAYFRGGRRGQKKARWTPGWRVVKDAGCREDSRKGVIQGSDHGGEEAEKGTPDKRHRGVISGGSLKPEGENM